VLPPIGKALPPGIVLGGEGTGVYPNEACFSGE
jgi:hypothetical protein